MMRRSTTLLLSLTLFALPSWAMAQAQPAAKQAPAKFQVQMDTSAGPVVIEVHRDWAPIGTDRFYQLVKAGYYNDIRAFRVIDGFVAQFGMSGDPKLTAKWRQSPIPDDPVKVSNKAGTITFATSGPNSRTTQLFINLEDNARLDDMGFAPFGKVVKGMENVQKFYSGYSGRRGQGPRQPLITARGNTYLDAKFPKLTKIKSIRVTQENGKPVGKTPKK